MGHVIHGHKHGYKKLLEALEWCLELQVECVSVYAFSIENFKRSRDEVEGLLSLAAEKLRSIAESDVIRQHDVVVSVVGDLTTLPSDVQAAAAHVMLLTRHNKGPRLDICFAYTGRQDMFQAIQSVQEGIQAGFLERGDLCEDVVERCLHTASSPPVDLLIRTSGETRLSDFLLWQCSDAVLVFLEVLWPDFSFMDLVGAIVSFQRGAFQVSRSRQKHSRLQLDHLMYSDVAAAQVAESMDARPKNGQLPRPKTRKGQSNKENCYSLLRVGWAQEKAVGDFLQSEIPSVNSKGGVPDAHGDVRLISSPTFAAPASALGVHLGVDGSSVNKARTARQARVEAFLRRLHSARWAWLKERTPRGDDSELAGPAV
ncbi:hypothetical protein CYMTET_21112 [Cymbomonas tetramitiformis]|uniref:Alkyl transferase n=1 Tax=Cymbomonas tetramitiformis TaxID=36881 RepID=A0AAE0G3G7_9CHLO|nr:hypothetical protein CYMTET_21112 [Cymbomonas tetramitiformis]|eukprot:gene25610-31308_t